MLDPQLANEHNNDPCPEEETSMFRSYKGICSDFNEYTLIVPCVAVGNVGQLTVDLLVSTLALERAGYMYDDSVLPVIGNDPYAEVGTQAKCRMVTSVEVYKSDEKKIAVVQQRAPCVRGKRKQYVTKLCEWIKSSNFSTVVILSSIFAHERRDRQLEGSPMRYFLLPKCRSLEPCLRDLGWRELETRGDLGDANIRAPPEGASTAEEYYMPGSGMMTQLCQQCEKDNVGVLGVVCFCAEGDNAMDAVAMASHLNMYFKWISTEKAPGGHGWTVPSSWQLQYGSRFRQVLY